LRFGAKRRPHVVRMAINGFLNNVDETPRF